MVFNDKIMFKNIIDTNTLIYRHMYTYKMAYSISIYIYEDIYNINRHIYLSKHIYFYDTYSILKCSEG